MRKYHGKNEYKLYSMSHRTSEWVEGNQFTP